MQGNRSAAGWVPGKTCRRRSCASPANPSGDASFGPGGCPETLKPEGVPAVPLLLRPKIRNAEWIKLVSPDPGKAHAIWPEREEEA